MPKSEVVPPDHLLASSTRSSSISPAVTSGVGRTRGDAHDPTGQQSPRLRELHMMRGIDGRRHRRPPAANPF